MRTQRKARKVSSGEDGASRLTIRAASVTPAGKAPFLRTDPLLQRRYQELTRKHLGGLFERLFAEFTGLHFQVAWAPLLGDDWSATTLPTDCTVCRLLAGAENHKYCSTCGPKHLVSTLGGTRKGHRFTCRLGMRNYWLPFGIDGMTVGIACLQALARGRSRKPGPPSSTHARIGISTRSNFQRAGRLLRLIVQHVQALGLAELRKVESTNAQQALRVFQTVQARLRSELSRIVPTLRKIPPVRQPDSRPDQTVHAVLDRIHQDHCQPITLLKCARDLRINAAYLSHLFSQRVGLPFKTYLTAVRLERARELLSDSTMNIAQVAATVGYASDNRFRIAFKQATGLSPNAWRATLQIQHPDPWPRTADALSRGSSLAAAGSRRGLDSRGRSPSRTG